MDEQRCTGHCCEEFPLPVSLNEVLNEPERWKDGPFIADMLLFKGAIQGVYANGQVSFMYTCRHFDKATRNCLAYEQRPDMCRDYPYGAPCEHKECTLPDRPDVTLDRLWESARLNGYRR